MRAIRIKLLALALLVSFAGTPLVFAALTTSISSFYKYAANANDSVGTNNGTDVNGPTYTTGLNGNALTCVGALSQYSNLPQASFGGFGTPSGAVNYFFKNVDITGPYMFIGDQNGNTGFLIYYSGGTIQATKPGNTALSYTWTADTNPHMLTFTASSTGMAMYLDAVLVANNTVSANFIAPGSDLIPVCAYGSGGGGFVGGWYYTGQVNKLGMWSRDLTPAEIVQLYNGGLGLDYPFAVAAALQGRFYVFNRGMFIYKPGVVIR